MPNLTDGEMRDEYAVFGTVASRGRPNGRRSTITFRRQYSCELDSIHLSDRSRLRRFARSDLRAHRHGSDAAHCSGCPLSSHDCSPLLGGSDFRDKNINYEQIMSITASKVAELIKRQEANQAALKNAFKKLGYDKAFEEVSHD